MPVPGRKSKPAGQARNRNKPTHDWTEVESTPFTGKALVPLPRKRQVRNADGELVSVELSELTRTWWKRISRMPHCRLWTESDWLFAVETAIVADALFRGTTTAATELRQREKILGTTVDARRDLRIKYVDPRPDVDDAEVTNIDDYREL